MLIFLSPIVAESCDDSKNKEQPKYQFEELKPDDEFAGIYELPLALTGGESLYIFPDGKFALTYSCDICMGEKLLAKGKYTKLSSSIILKYSTEYLGEREKVYYIRHAFKQYEGLVEMESNLPLLLEKSQLSEIGSENSFYSYLHRVTPYPNWKNKSTKLLSKKINKVGDSNKSLKHRTLRVLDSF